MFVLSMLSDTLPTSGTGTDLEWADRRKQRCPAKEKLLRAYKPLLYQVLLDINPCLSLIFMYFLSGTSKLFPSYAESCTFHF